MGLKASGQINGSKSIKGCEYKVAVLGHKGLWLRVAGGCDASAHAPGACKSWGACWVMSSVTSYRLPVLYIAFFPDASVIHDDERAESVLDQAWSSLTLCLLLQECNYFWLRARLT